MKCSLLGLFLLLSPLLWAQRVPPALAAKLQGKTTVQSIMQEVDAFFAGEGKSLRSKKEDAEEDQAEDDYLFWKRWEWWMLSHLDENGQFVKINKKNLEAAQQADQKWGAILPKDAFTTVRKAGSETQKTARVTAVENSYGAWTSIGPVDNGSTAQGDIKGLGRIDRIAFHPSNANVFYIGSPTGGVWKTTDGGANWSFISGSLPALGVSGIVVSPTNGNVIYVLSGDGDSYSPGYLVYDYGSSSECTGVFKSVDGGATWTKTGDLYTGASTFEGHRLAISPTNGNYLIAATSQGLWRTTNGGTSWTQVRTGEYWDVEFKPSNDSVVYASASGDVYYSTDGGRSGTWNTSSFDFTNGSGRIELAVSPNNASYVYAVCGEVPSAGTFRGLFRSTNSGVDFFRRSNTPNILGSSKTGSDDGSQAGYDLGITVKPSEALYVVTCGMNVWRTSANNGGSTMVNSTVYRENQAVASEFIHPDVHVVAYNPLNDYLYAGSDGGIYRSTDNGVSWSNLSGGVSTSQFYRFAMQDADANGEMDGVALLAGAQDNGIKYRTSGTSYKHVICCDGFGTAIAPNNANTLYMNINDGFYKSTNAGDNYSSLIGTVTFFSPVAIDYNNSSTVYLGGSSTRRSINGFSSTDHTTAVSTRRVLVTCPSNSNRLYGSSGSNVIRSDDKIDTWTTKSGNPGWPAGTLTVNDIKPLPINSLTIYVCFGGYSAGNKVLRSIDGGDSWTNWSGSLPNVPCYSLAVDTAGRVYVGTEIGVFYRQTSYSDWVPFYSYMPRIPVTGLWVNGNGNVYASTFGRGMWFSSRKTDCDDNIMVGLTGIAGPWYFEAGNSVTSTLTSDGGVGTEIFMRAGNRIDLMPGFEVKAGTFFKGYIAPCNTGGIPNTNRAAMQAVSFPDVKELTHKKAPESDEAYWKINAKGELEFLVTQKGPLEFYARDSVARLVKFYPSGTYYPGLYSLPLPNASIRDVFIRQGNKEFAPLGKSGGTDK